MFKLNIPKKITTYFLSVLTGNRHVTSYKLSLGARNVFVSRIRYLGRSALYPYILY